MLVRRCMLLCGCGWGKPELQSGLDLHTLVRGKKGLDLSDEALAGFRAEPALEVLQGVEVEHNGIDVRPRRGPDDIDPLMPGEVLRSGGDLLQPRDTNGL